jgi:hypothetical protein
MTDISENNMQQPLHTNNNNTTTTYTKRATRSSAKYLRVITIANMKQQDFMLDKMPSSPTDSIISPVSTTLRKKTNKCFIRKF